MFPAHDVAERVLDAIAGAFPSVAHLAMLEIGHGRIDEYGQVLGPWTPLEQLRIIEAKIDSLIVTPLKAAGELEHLLPEFEIDIAASYVSQGPGEDPDPVPLSHPSEEDFKALKIFQSTLAAYIGALEIYLVENIDPDVPPDPSDDLTPTRRPRR